MQTSAERSAQSVHKPTSIKDIARMANVSSSTVSRALQSSPLISRETAERIQHIAKQSGYRASAIVVMAARVLVDEICVLIAAAAKLWPIPTIFVVADVCDLSSEQDRGICAPVKTKLAFPGFADNRRRSFPRQSRTDTVKFARSLPGDMIGMEVWSK